MWGASSGRKAKWVRSRANDPEARTKESKSDRFADRTTLSRLRAATLGCGERPRGRRGEREVVDRGSAMHENIVHDRPRPGYFNSVWEGTCGLG